ncbi:hypothetical protein BKA70DRAFT_490814 [Coprinopsis sp. MPI-PUGE-AT-0042]|nr:hypothetical protein BKA70DRAFT_490814 [Coprinopsis sp. MPI-PUGE-AT-0042]
MVLPLVPARYSALRARLDGWMENPPRSQFSLYGPLNAILALRFGPEAFLVKPQKMLRDVADSSTHGVETESEYPAIKQASEEGGSSSNQDGREKNQGSKHSKEGDYMSSGDYDVVVSNLGDFSMKDGAGEGGTEDDPGNGSMDFDDNFLEAGDISLDSNAFEVEAHAVFPDFVVEEFWGADANGTAPDVIRIVFELTSLPKRKGNTGKGPQHLKLFTENRVAEYVKKVVGRSYGGPVLGVGILGNQVWMQWTFPASVEEDINLFSPIPRGWMPLCEGTFSRALEELQTYCMDRHDELGDRLATVAESD